MPKIIREHVPASVDKAGILAADLINRDIPRVVRLPPRFIFDIFSFAFDGLRIVTER